MNPARPLCFRVTAELKARIEEAARRRGQSVTTFLREAAEAAVQRAETKTPVSERASSGVPTFFRLCCEEAARGGEFGYWTPGYELSRHLAAKAPRQVKEEEWQAALDKLHAMLFPAQPGAGCDDKAVWGWFEENLPACAALIPKRRRQQFLSGVYQAADDGIITLEV